MSNSERFFLSRVHYLTYLLRSLPSLQNFEGGKFQCARNWQLLFLVGLGAILELDSVTNPVVI